ncbi:D-alanyl-D-alanine carboxypeptidase family protein [Ammoniphilus sp. 3BR4]|uniref:D-alanyl-D-alanine carboxypeptidase family protein n=1 Tax=Ammoniphilus sp. 3BR4 TaxID=3158265 RepID=UPI0034661EE5
MFSHHLLKEEFNGFVVILYMNSFQMEFAREFGNKEEYRQWIQQSVKQYVQEHLPGVKLKAAKVMLGSLLIATIPIDTGKVFAQNEHNISSHRVVKGDTLALIAQRYQTTTEEIKYTNRLVSDEIYIGQILHIPSSIIRELPNGILKWGSRGEAVRKLQEVLLLLGYRIEADGIFGPKMHQVMLHFQRAHHLQADGIYGLATRQQLKERLFHVVREVRNPLDRLVLVNKRNALPSGFVPPDLVIPNVPFSFAGFDPKKQMREEAARALSELFKQAEKEEIYLYAASGYRSYDRQKSIFASSVSRNGWDLATKYSAKPGQSEHQTGLAMDVTSRSANFALTSYFGETPEGKWLAQNAHEFGFIVRYPKDKENLTGYEYEPWHIRYIGKQAAKYIFEEDLTLEAYIGG